MPIPLPSRPARCRPDSGTKADRRTLLRRRVRGGLGLDFRRPHPTSLFTRLIGHLSQGDHPTTPRAVRQEQPWTCIGIPWMYTVLGPVSRAKRGCSSVVERHVANPREQPPSCSIPLRNDRSRMHLHPARWMCASSRHPSKRPEIHFSIASNIRSKLTASIGLDGHSVNNSMLLPNSG